MASLKPLKSVAHNLPHHFASTLNWWGDDYAIDHLAKAVSALPGKRIEIDVLAQTSAPLISGIAREAIAALRKTLWQLTAKAGLDPTILSSATIEYDFGVPRRDPVHNLPCYDCVCTLSTSCGRTYRAQLTEANK